MHTHTLPRPSRFFDFAELDRWITRKVASDQSTRWRSSAERSQTIHMLVEIGDTTPNGQKSNCLNDRSGKLNQLEANPLSLSFSFSFSILLLLLDGKNCRRLSLSLSLCLSDSARRDSNGMAEITRICFSPSLGTISRLTGAARRQEKNELEWIRKARIKRKRRRGQSHSNRQFIRA